MNTNSTIQKKYLSWRILSNFVQFRLVAEKMLESKMAFAVWTHPFLPGVILMGRTLHFCLFSMHSSQFCAHLGLSCRRTNYSTWRHWLNWIVFVGSGSKHRTQFTRISLPWYTLPNLIQRLIARHGTEFPVSISVFTASQFLTIWFLKKMSDLGINCPQTLKKVRLQMKSQISIDFIVLMLHSKFGPDQTSNFRQKVLKKLVSGFSILQPLQRRWIVMGSTI